MDHLQRFDVTNFPIDRWWAAAERLGDAGRALRLELSDLIREPTRHMLQRAARAARQAERVTVGLEQQVANAVAGAIEDAIEGPHDP